MRTTILFILSCTLVLLSSCSDTPGTLMEEEQQGGTITTEAYTNLNRPCVDDGNALALTPPLQLETNYLRNEHTAEIHAIVTLSEQFRLSVGNLFFPPVTAVRASVDNISIFADDEAYEWSVADEKYVFRQTDDGYQILYYGPESLAGREMVVMTQDEACSQMDYTQYTVVAEHGKSVGDIEFKYEYQQAGTGKIVYFGTCINDPNSSAYYVRIFEDLSGQIRITNAGDLSKTLWWEANGNGTFELWEDGQQVDSGFWTL